MSRWFANTPLPFRCALCGLWLVAALPATILAAAGLSIPFGMEPDFASWPLPVAFTLVHAAAGAIWAVSLARLTGHTAQRWVGVAGALGVAIPFWVAILALNELEQKLVWFHVRSIPIHQIFMGSFALTALGVAGIAAGALGAALGGAGLAARLALRGGVAAGLAFLAVALLMDVLGYRVGAPGAEERVTMLTVMLAGMVGAALVGNLVVGVLLRRAQRPVAAARLAGEAVA